MTAPRWDRPDLIRRLCRALDIAAQSLGRLGTNGYQDPNEPANSLPPEKLISETATLLVAAAAVPHAEPVATRIDHLARLLIPLARSDRMRLGLCLRPALAWDYGLAHLCLHRLGYADAPFDELLRRSLQSQASAGRERVPHRLLEIEWMRRMQANAAPSGPDACSPAARQSVLNHPIDLFGATREDIYAFTHAVMYTGGFNLCPATFPRPRDVLLAEADAALAGVLDSEDYDIAGELLLCWPLTGMTWDAAAAFGFRLLADIENQVGFLPAAATRLDRLRNLQGQARSEYLTATAYHTAYVMGLLCAAALAPEREPPLAIPVEDIVPGSAAAIAPFIEDGSRRRHWQDAFDHLSTAERDAISGLILTIALHRRIAAHDFAAVVKLLEAAVSLGLATGPAASQAAELLDRLALFATNMRS